MTWGVINKFSFSFNLILLKKTRKNEKKLKLPTATIKGSCNIREYSRFGENFFFFIFFMGPIKRGIIT